MRAQVSEKSRVGHNNTSKRGVTRQGHQTQSLSLSLSLSLFRVNVSPAQKKRRRTVIPSAGFFCKSLICFTIAPTAPLETWSMTMMILMSFLPPSRFSPKPLLKRQRWVDELLSLSLTLSLSLFVVVVVDTNRLEEKDAAPALSKRVVSRSFVRAKERAIIAFCVADVTNNTSFFWGRKVVVAKSFFFFLWSFQSAFFLSCDI